MSEWHIPLPFSRHFLLHPPKVHYWSPLPQQSPTRLNRGKVEPQCFNIYLAMSGLSCGMWDLVPWPGIKPIKNPALRAWSLCHWTTREVPGSQCYNPSSAYLWFHLCISFSPQPPLKVPGETPVPFFLACGPKSSSLELNAYLHFWELLPLTEYKPSHLPPASVLKQYWHYRMWCNLVLLVLCILLGFHRMVCLADGQFFLSYSLRCALL